MESRTAVRLLPLAVTAVVFVAAFGMQRGPAGRTDPGHGEERGPGAVATEGAPQDLLPTPGRGTNGGPPLFTRFDIALLVLGSLGIVGFCLRVPGLVGATPFGGRARLREALLASRRWCVRGAPLLLLGVALMTATTAAAQEATGPPYVGMPPVGEGPPYVETSPGVERPPLDGVASVDALPYVAPAPVQSPGALDVAGRAPMRTRAGGELAALEAATEGPTGSPRSMPVTAGDVVGLVVLGAAVVLSVLLPRWRCR